jgi:hypothetical protein
VPHAPRFIDGHVLQAFHPDRAIGLTALQDAVNHQKRITVR